MRVSTLIGVLLALTIGHAGATAVKVAAPTGSCSGSVKDAWLDVVFLVDSSAGMTVNGLRNAEAFVKSVMRQMTIGDDEYGKSRIGIITYAAEAVVERDLSRTDNVVNPLTFSGEKDSNLLDAIYAAQAMFNNFTSVIGHHHQVIVIAASTFKSGGMNDPTQAAAQFVEDGGDIVTIDYHNKDVGLSPLSKLATNGFAFTNDDQEVTNLFNSFLNVNCFCGDSLYTVSNSPHGSPVSGCLGEVNWEADWFEAAANCKERGAYLIKIEGDDDHNALNKLIKDSFWIGLKYDQDRKNFYWPDWTQPAKVFWDTGFPDLTVGECAYNKDSKWYSAPCGGDQEGYVDFIYYCESLPCSSGNDCFNPIAKEFTAPPLNDDDSHEESHEESHEDDGDNDNKSTTTDQ